LRVVWTMELSKNMKHYLEEMLQYRFKLINSNFSTKCEI
jgi:hypothetical protein